MLANGGCQTGKYFAGLLHAGLILCAPIRHSVGSLHAAGEAYDKVARLLGLDQRPSGGAAVEALAREGDPVAYKWVGGKGGAETETQCGLVPLTWWSAYQREKDPTARKWEGEAC